MYEAGVMGMEGGKGWFDKGWVMVVEKGRLSKVGLLEVVVVVWWRGGDNNNARARAGKSRKTLFLFLLHCCVWFYVCVGLLVCLMLLFCKVRMFWFLFLFYVFVLCLRIYLFVYCTQSF